MNDIISSGWEFYDRCRCSGRVKEYYRHPIMTDLELEYYPRHKAFKITYLGTTTKVPNTAIGNISQVTKTIKQEYESTAKAI